MGDEKNDSPSCLQESQIGVTEYVSNFPPFIAVIKARFSDFHVNELDLDGNEVVLNSLKVPVPEVVVPNQENVELIDDDHIKEIRQMLQTGDPNCVEIDVTSLGKEERTALHTKIKGVFGNEVISTTEQQDLKKVIKCTKYSKNAASNRRAKWPWPHEYTCFVLFKENIDTMKAALLLSTNLRIHPSSIAYAGTKDRRGKTSQLFCIKHKDPQTIAKAASRIHNIHVGNFSFKPDVLKLGKLMGNRFRIVLRQIKDDEEQIELSLKSLQEKGFLNYYGLQRFGNCQEIPTYEIGKALLHSDFKKACELIMKPRGGEKPFMDQMRKIWWDTRDARSALKNVYKSNRSVEAKLLEGFVRHGKNDFVNTLNNVPRNCRLLYLHAYQSLIFNKIVSRRIKTFGLKLMVGDLVFVDTSFEKQNIDSADTLLDEDSEIQDSEPIENEEKIQPEESSAFKSLVRPLTEEDIKSGKYTIYDVVLPLPGHDIAYPKNEIDAWYKEFLAEDDLSSEKLKQKLKLYSLTGAYRKWIVKPEKMSWHFKKYNLQTDTLVLSDLEKLKGVPEPADATDGPLKALIIDFCLPSSTYATMALRELLRHDTSGFSQSQLEKTLTSETLANQKASELGLKRENSVNSGNEEIPVKKVKTDE